MPRKQRQEKLPYSGSFLTFEPGRIDIIKERLYSPGVASESFSAIDWEFERREIALLSFSPQDFSIDAIVLMERMHGSGGTGKLKMRMWSPLLIEKSIRQDEVADAFPAADRLCTAETFKRIPHTEWPLVIGAIKSLRPILSQSLDTLIALRDEKNPLVGDDEKILRLTEQRDAIGLTLDIASLDRKTILREARFEDIHTASSVLDLLDARKPVLPATGFADDPIAKTDLALLDAEPVHEQDLIRQDQLAFEGLLRKNDVRSMQFTGLGERKVRVHVYDKKPLETILGIDLLIYLSDFKSYLLLQYKCMQSKSDDEEKTWSYQVDSQLHKQFEAMDSAVEAISKLPLPSPSSIADWRLSGEGFFFKFCETTRPDSRDDALVAGITLSHSHLKQFLQLPQSRGKRGGQQVSYGNCPRYLNNTQFISLAREGWIGCDARGYSLISEVIKAGQENGRAAMLAVIEGSGAKTAQDRSTRIR